MKAEKSEYAEYENSYWWCPNCKEELSGCRVTYQEKCDTCGHAVVWVENKDMDEFERLAEIGRATEMVFENQQFCIAAWKHPSLMTFKNAEDLLEWYRAQEVEK